MRMRQRHITPAQVEEVLRKSERDYAARRIRGVRTRARVYVGVSDGRTIKVYVTPGTNPVWVRTVV